MRTEDTILSALMQSEEYARKVIPHLDKDYFAERTDLILYDEISSFFLKYNALPTRESIQVQVQNRNGVSQSDLEESLTKLQNLSPKSQNLDWLLESTEKFCKDRAVYNAIMKAIVILDGDDKTHTKEGIPSLLQAALGVTFDASVGHSYIDDAAARFDMYTRVDAKIRFDIKMLNDITTGGLSRKSLTLLLAASGGGKSLVMSHMAAANLRDGMNVLYISLEMSEEKIAERIDANLLNVDIDKIALLGKNSFCDKIDGIASKTRGRLFVKEYPTGAGHAGHFRGLLEELKTKQNFVPDVMYVDYLGICASAKMKMGGSVNSYAYLKSIAEELRGLAVENDIALVSAGQVNRGAYNASDLDLSDTSECLSLDSVVYNTSSREYVRIDSLKPGDNILGSIGPVVVMKTHHTKVKRKYKITTKSGKVIECSADHAFPTNRGRLNISKGLKAGDFLSSRSVWPKEIT